MSIELAPRKPMDDKKEELRKFFNAEHGANDLTPEEVKKILNCTPEDAINEAVESFIKEEGEEMWNTFLKCSTSLLAEYDKKVAQAHLGCELVINTDETNYMKRVATYMQSKGATIDYKPRIGIEYLDASVVFTFKSSCTFYDMDFLAELCGRCSVTVSGFSKKRGLNIRCGFYNIGKYVKVKGDNNG